MGVGVQHLRAVADDATVLLCDAGQEAGDVDKRHDRDVEAVAEADELRTLIGGVDVQNTGHDRRIVGNEADGAACDTAEANHEVAGEASLDLQEVAPVGDLADDVADVVALLACLLYTSPSPRDS